jgi:hypothetical protein
MVHPVETPLQVYISPASIIHLLMPLHHVRRKNRQELGFACLYAMCARNDLFTSAPAGNMGECVTEGPSAPEAAGLMGSFDYGKEFGQLLV